MLKRWRKKYGNNDNYDGKKLLCQVKKLIEREWLKPKKPQERRKEKRNKYKAPEPKDINEHANEYSQRLAEWMIDQPKPTEVVKRRKPVIYWTVWGVEKVLKKEIKDKKLVTLENVLDRLAHLKMIADDLANKEDKATKATREKRGYRKIIRELYWKLELVGALHTKLVNKDVEQKVRKAFKIGNKKELTKKWKDTKILELRNLISQTRKRIKNLKKFKKMGEIDPNKVKTEIVKSGNPKELLKKSTEFWHGIWGIPLDASNTEIRKTLDPVDEIAKDKPLDGVWSNFGGDEAILALKKKKNFSAPGPDGISNYWLKQMKEILAPLVAKEMNRWSEQGHLDLTRYTEGRTVLIIKDTKQSPDNPGNYRPITCLNTAYKWITSILLARLNVECERRGIIDPNQRGAKKGSWGTVVNNRIDREVTKRYGKDIYQLWVDFKKAFDSISHRYLWKCIKRSIGKSARKIWMNIVRNWKTKLEIEGEKSDFILFKRGIYQGDSLCPALFILCLNPLSIMLSRSVGVPLFEGKVTHLLYIDDLKLYELRFRRIQQQYKLTKRIGKVVGLEPNPAKCGICRPKGEPHTTVNHDNIPKVTVENNYKYLGIKEDSEILVKETIVTAAEKFQAELTRIWRSKASSWNKMNATNVKANALVKYIMFNLDISWDLIERWATAQRVIIRAAAEIEKTTTNVAMHGPRCKGYMGIEDLECLYIKAKAAVVLHLAKCETEYMKNAIYPSIVEEARKVLAKINVKLEDGTLTYNGEGFPLILKKECKDLLANAFWHKWALERIEQKWTGNFDNKVGYKNLFWATNKMLSQPLINDIIEMREDNKPHKANLLRRKLAADKFCRHCGYENENQEHIAVGCTKFLKYYTRRHNKIVKKIAYEIIAKGGSLKEYRELNPNNVKVRGRYKAGKGEILLEPVFWLEEEHKYQKPDLLWIDHENKRVYMLEVGVTWDSRIEERRKEKETKYETLLPILRKQYRGYKIKNKPIIVGALGTISDELKERMEKLFKSDIVVKRLQLDTIRETLEITKNFLN